MPAPNNQTTTSMTNQAINQESISMRRVATTALCAFSLLAASMNVAQAQSMTRESQQSLAGSGLLAGAVVLTSAASLAGTTELVVRGVKAAGSSAANTVVLSVAGTASAVQGSIQLSQETMRAAGVSVGTALKVSAITTGYMVMSPSGFVLAFVPNEQGAHLIHRQRAS